MSAAVRAVITADNHLNRYYDRMSPQRLQDRRRHLRQGFRAAVDYAIEHHADLFLQVGDLFDTPDPRNIDREFVAQTEKMQPQERFRKVRRRRKHPGSQPAAPSAGLDEYKFAMERNVAGQAWGT